jgi:hypothetical protein
MKMPDEKLTLKLKRSAIARGKAVAKRRGTSVSRMVEDYFESIGGEAPSAADGAYSPRLKSLMGLLKVPDDFDWKEERAKGLMQKYGVK